MPQGAGKETCQTGHVAITPLHVAGLEIIVAPYHTDSGYGSVQMTTEIRWSQLRTLKKLGGGQAGEVSLVELKRPFREYPAGTHLAAKAYRPWVLEQPEQIKRINRELQIGRQFQHPNVVRTVALTEDDSGRPVLLMEFYEGKTLEEFLQARRDNDQRYLLPTQGLAIVRGLASALICLHEHGVVHRDVKPANVVLGPACPVLMDLGVVSEPDPGHTTTTTFLGTARYAAPEYLFGSLPDKRVDLYALGAIVYEVFSGRRYFGEISNWAVMIASKAPGQHQDSWTNDITEAVYGANVTRFIHTVLALTLTADPSERRIDLQALISAIDAGVWRTDRVRYGLASSLGTGAGESRVKQGARKKTRKGASKKKTTKKKTTKKKASSRKVPKKKAAKKKAAKKKAPKKKSKRKPYPAFMKPMQPDAALAAVVGSTPIPRVEITKKLWVYIKKNGLQDSKNRRMINADAALKAVFGGKSQVSMFEMTKLVSRHMS